MKRKSGAQQPQQQQQRPARKEKRSRRSEQHELAAAAEERAVTAPDDGPAIREGGSFTQLQLQPHQSVVLSGAAVLEVTHGCVAVFGALVTPESGPVQLQAPSKLGKALLLTALPLNSSVAPPAAPSSAATLAVLQPLDGSSSSGGGSNYTVVDAAAPDAPAAWLVPGAWQQAAADLMAAAAGAAAPLVAAVCGSKGAGKSAFARLLANSLLSAGAGAVAYLDLDPGQPEFTPPGLLSLHLLRQPVFGAAHLQHAQPPLLQFFQGDTSSQSEPGRYLQAVQALVSRYHSLAAQPDAAAAAASGGGGGGVSALPPLVINTPGWITGLGLELLGEVLRCAQPTHVVQLATSNPKKNLPSSCWWSDGAAAATAAPPLLMQVPSVGGADATAAGSSSAALAGPCLSGASGDTTLTGAASKGRGMSAVASRGLMWLAWAQRIIAANPAAAAAAAPASDAAAASADEFAGAAAGLAAAVPFEASLAGLRVEVLHAQVAPADLAAALNGAIVGLAAAAGPSDGSDAAGAATAAAGSQPPRECVGLGLVRAVDARRQALYLLTDVPPEQLARVEVLTLGKLELPDRLLEGRGAASPYQGLFCLSSTATGAGQIKSRNNLLRASRMGLR